MDFRGTIGYDREPIPAMTAGPATTDSLMALLKATLERLGTAVTDGDPSVYQELRYTKWLTKPKGYQFFLDGSAGNDANDGLSPAKPKLTLTAAIGLCTSGRDDVIYVLNYGAAGKAAEPAWPIPVNLNMLHILGVQCMENSKWPTIQANSDNHALAVTGQRVEIANLEVGGGATHAAIACGSVGGVWATWIHDVWFGVTGDTTGQDGVYVANGNDAPYLCIDRCRFGSSVTRYPIYIAGNATRGLLGWRDGNFFRAANIAINVTGAAGLSGILNNIFGLPSDTAGYAITLGAGTSGAVIDGNKAAYQIAAMSNNPFRDLSNANHWLVNWRQGLTIAPDIV